MAVKNSTGALESRREGPWPRAGQIVAKDYAGFLRYVPHMHSSYLSGYSVITIRKPLYIKETHKAHWQRTLKATSYYRLTLS